MWRRFACIVSAMLVGSCRLAGWSRTIRSRHAGREALAACDKPATSDKPAADNAACPAMRQPAELKRLSKTGEIWLDTKRKAVVIDGQVCLREGNLEMFACPKGTKEHESVVSLNCQPEEAHAGLLAAGAKPGKPVRFDPKYEPASGDMIDIYVLWRDETGEKAAGQGPGVGQEHQDREGDGVRLGLRRQRLLEGRRDRQGALPGQRRRLHLRLELSQRHARPARSKARRPTAS